MSQPFSLFPCFLTPSDIGIFWLSETPDVPSVSWDSTFERSCTYALFTQKTGGKKFWFFASHLDIKNSLVKYNQMNVIARKTGSIATGRTPAFVLGDMNSDDNGSAVNPIRPFMSNVRDIAPITDYKYTYNNYGERFERYDHIFARGQMKVLSFETLDKQYLGVPYISDHYPILAKVNLAGTDIVGGKNISGTFTSNISLAGDCWALMEGNVSASEANVNNTAAPCLKLGTSSSSGSCSFLSPRKGDFTLRMYAVAWKGISSKLTVSASGNARIDGESSKTVILPSNADAIYTPPFYLYLADSDLLSFKVTGADIGTRITIRTGIGDGIDPRALIVGLNWEGGLDLGLKTLAYTLEMMPSGYGDADESQMIGGRNIWYKVHHLYHQPTIPAIRFDKAENSYIFNWSDLGEIREVRLFGTKEKNTWSKHISILPLLRLQTVPRRLPPPLWATTVSMLLT